MGTTSDPTTTAAASGPATMAERLTHLIEVAPTLPSRRLDDVGVQDGETLKTLSREEHRAKVEANRQRYARWRATQAHR